MTRVLLALVLLAALPAPLCAMESEPSLRAMLGQMMLVGFRGTELSDDAPILRDIREHNLGGVILFDRDVQLGTRRAGEFAACERKPVFLSALRPGPWERVLLMRRGFRGNAPGSFWRAWAST